MNFILTYNISNDYNRNKFESEVQNRFQSYSKEHTNQTTIVASSGGELDNVKNILQSILESIGLLDMDAITLYYPDLDNGKPIINRFSVKDPSVVEETQEKDIYRMKFLMTYARLTQ